MLSLITGFIVGLGLIVAIGAQNAWVLSQCMRGENRLIIALVCMACDIFLITLGVYGLQEIEMVLPQVVPLLTWLGVSFLLYLTWQSVSRAWLGTSSLHLTAEVIIRSPWKTVVATLAITLLNPHVYLDTVVLIGSVGNQQTQPLLFTLGASLASVFWFASLTACAPKLASVMKSQRHWQYFDYGMATLLLGVSASLIYKL
ncbi:MAG: L-lysine exporter family protein LysE/ArgO [Paraglaciecola sp.]|jgi:L-lysine exporter family protein LysE/ArgO